VDPEARGEMTRRRTPALVALAVAAAAGCGGGRSANWLTDPGVAGHSRFFPLQATPHDPTAPGASVTCQGCHPGNTFAQFDCATCHTAAATDPLHAGVSGYAHASPACLQCHPTGSIAPPPNHDAADFPRGAGTAHAAVGCLQCHTDLASPTVTASFACASCHAGLAGGFVAGHASVAGVDASTASPQCLLCHGDGQTNPVAAHTRFPIARGSSTHDTACLQCHTATRAGQPYPAAADFGAFDCLGCHAQAPTASAHAGVAGYAYASPSCYGCHPTGAGGGMPADHDTAFFPRGAGSAHAAVGCTQCHTDLTAPANPSSFACGSCHLSLDPTLVARHTTSPSNPRVAVGSGEISTGDSATCLRCHADSQVALTSSHPSGTRGDPPHEGARCLQCHDVVRSDKPFGADFASDPAAASKLAARHGCYQCHRSAPPGGD
jgi:hypothetical protein